MGATQSKEESIQSPKQHCPKKPFPTQPLPIPHIKKESSSLPCSFENKLIKQNNGHQESSMGRQVQTNPINRHYITSTYLKNYTKHDSKQLSHTPSF